MPASVNGINVINDITQNFSLTSGFVLSGTVTSTSGQPVFGGSVTATSGSQSFVGPVQFNPFAGGSTYRVVLPAGTYNVSVQLFQADMTTQSSLTLSIEVMSGLAITGNRTLNITVPVPALFTVSGTVTSAGSLPTNGTVRFATADGRTNIFGQFNSSYRIAVPAGNYIVFVIITMGNNSSGLTLNQTTINVTAATTLNLILPPVFNVNGTLKNNTGGALAPSGISFSDTGGMIQNTTAGTAAVASNSTTGAYSLLLPAGSFAPGASTSVSLGGSTQGTFGFTPTPNPLVVAAAVTYNVMAPAPPAVRTISGRVTGAGGAAVANAIVSASTLSLSGIPNGFFANGVTTAADGSYSLRVYSGMAYTITASPPNS